MIDPHVKISEGGRIVIAAEFRKALGIDIGDELILHLEHGRMTLLTRKQAVLYVQEQTAQYMTTKDILPSEQLIAERRTEAADELPRASLLDASSLLSLLGREPGAERVEPFVLQGNAIVSAVNASEGIAKHAERGMPAERTLALLQLIGLQLHVFDSEDGMLAGSLRTGTKQLGLSFGDRVCLALAMKLKVTAVTADRTWSKLELPIEIVQIRP